MFSLRRRNDSINPDLPEEIKEVISLLKERARRRKFQWYRLGFLTCISLLYLMLSLKGGNDVEDMARLLLFVGVAGWYMGSILQSERVTSDAEKRIQEILSDRLDISVIGPLIDSIDVDVHHPDTHSAIIKTLTSQLPRLHVENSYFLTESQLSRLYRVLEYSVHPFWYRYYDAECVVAIIHALEHIGDSRAVLIVKRLSFIASDRRVVIAATECLPRMKARLEREESHQKLLRAAPPPDIALVRPAATPIEDLVRPAPEPEAEMSWINANKSAP